MFGFGDVADLRSQVEDLREERRRLQAAADANAALLLDREAIEACVDAWLREPDAHDGFRAEWNRQLVIKLKAAGHV